MPKSHRNEVLSPQILFYGPLWSSSFACGYCNSSLVSNAMHSGRCGTLGVPTPPPNSGESLLIGCLFFASRDVCGKSKFQACQEKIVNSAGMKANSRETKAHCRGKSSSAGKSIVPCTRHHHHFHFHCHSHCHCCCPCTLCKEGEKKLAWADSECCNVRQEMRGERYLKEREREEKIHTSQCGRGRPWSLLSESHSCLMLQQPS
jgi:hypothetical protein